MNKLEKNMYYLCLFCFGFGAVAAVLEGNWSAATYAVTSMLWCSLSLKYRFIISK